MLALLSNAMDNEQMKPLLERIKKKKTFVQIIFKHWTFLEQAMSSLD